MPEMAAEGGQRSCSSRELLGWARPASCSARLRLFCVRREWPVNGDCAEWSRVRASS